MAAGYLLLPAAGNTPAGIYLMMGVLGIGWASTISLVFAVMTRVADSARMGLYMGLFNLAVVLPQLAVSLGIARYVHAVEHHGGNLDVIFWIAASSLALSAVTWWGVPAQAPDAGSDEGP